MSSTADQVASKVFTDSGVDGIEHPTGVIVIPRVITSYEEWQACGTMDLCLSEVWPTSAHMHLRACTVVVREPCSRCAPAAAVKIIASNAVPVQGRAGKARLESTVSQHAYSTCNQALSHEKAHLLDKSKCPPESDPCACTHSGRAVDGLDFA
jgi:hypothetical protein